MGRGEGGDGGVEEREGGKGQERLLVWTGIGMGVCGRFGNGWERRSRRDNGPTGEPRKRTESGLKYRIECGLETEASECFLVKSDVGDDESRWSSLGLVPGLVDSLD